MKLADDYCEKGDYNMAVVYYQKAYDEKPSEELKNLIFSTGKLCPTPLPAATVAKEPLIYIPDMSFSLGIIGLSPTATMISGSDAVVVQP
jgi:hypothetical protein